MSYFLYSLGLLSLAAAFSFAPGPLRAVIACAFALHLLVGLFRAARLGHWWSFFDVLGSYLFVGLLFPKAICIIRGFDTGSAWNLALGVVAFAMLGLWAAAWAKGVKVAHGYPAHARLREYLSFGWLDEASA